MHSSDLSPHGNRPPSPRRTRLVYWCAVGVVAMAALVSCGTSGRELRPVVEGATGPPRTTSSTTPPPAEVPDDAATPIDEADFDATDGQVPVDALLLTTDAWEPGATIDLAYTCEGDDISPPLRWSGVPEGAASVALVVTDPIADDFVHWLVTGIEPTDGEIAQDQVPAGATLLTNSSGTERWRGPCPPPGETRTYHFTLLALGDDTAAVADDEASTNPNEVVATLEQEALGRSLLTGTFTRD